MLCQSKIEVWYEVSGERILLGETNKSTSMDVISLWVDLPFDLGSSSTQGYRVSLFDDGGRCIGDKSISQTNAEKVLKNGVAIEMCQGINQFCFSDRSSNQADFALI
ncbi:hypothetical protein MACH09_15830 [Vibrio sp. MACH09]|uniref:hypothetical protein n=1 Tax=unclassified Vibrio TaxID=2614977 RepID=UPI0020A2B54F|nr:MULTISPECIES: hypothetical protein [unclassified Vibrio]GLO61075.1 hypothetical protein MACH09_15830 [Vibrio sp. MACH09]